MESTKINCPSCAYEFNVEDVLSKRLEEKYRQQLSGKISELEKDFRKKEDGLKQRERELLVQAEEIEQRVEEQVQKEAVAKEAELRKKIDREYEIKIKALSEAEAEARQKAALLNETKIENERLKRQMDSQRQNIELEFEMKLTDRLKEETDSIRRREQEGTALKIRELEKKLEDQTKLAEEMKRKAEQGSMQLQGEVQELEIEQMLRDMYEREGDEIVEVKKGQRGADVLHVVKTRSGDRCGQIYYESKRTKEFKNDWLQKLRDDNLDVKADVLVLITEAMPSGRDAFFYKDGVWICSLREAKGLSLALRFGITQMYSVAVSQQGRETKMEWLYDYLTGKEFADQFSAIVEGFESLQKSYLDERKKMENIWKQREKQLQKIMTNAARFYGSIKGIAGQSIPHIEMLEGDRPLLESEKDAE